MRAWHATCGKKQCPIPAARAQIIEWYLDELSKRPGAQTCNQHLVLEQCQKIHSDSSSKGMRTSPATFFTLSSAASSNTLQRSARACPRSNHLIESSSWFCSPS